MVLGNVVLFLFFFIQPWLKIPSHLYLFFILLLLQHSDRIYIVLLLLPYKYYYCCCVSAIVTKQFLGAERQNQPMIIHSVRSQSHTRGWRLQTQQLVDVTLAKQLQPWPGEMQHPARRSSMSLAVRQQKYTLGTWTINEVASKERTRTNSPQSCSKSRGNGLTRGGLVLVARCVKNETQGVSGWRRKTQGWQTLHNK